MRAILAGLLTIAAPLIVSDFPALAQAPDAARIGEISAWIQPGTCSATPSISDRDFWQRVADSPQYRSEVKGAERVNQQPFASLPDDLYLEYSQVGNRTHYESVYFAKLKAFRALVVAECIENKGRFIEAIQQGVQSYAADKTWVLPAHDSGNQNFEGREITIDLFSSEVACELANAVHMLGTRLDGATDTLVRQEVRRRILEPYAKMVTGGKPGSAWLTTTNNWNAVCLANVTSTALALLEDPSERAFYVASAEKYIAFFLKGFTDDGYCSEGIGYWNYGYGCFVRLGHILDLATGGKIDLFASPKARSAGTFARRMEITPGQYPAFADCGVGSQPGPNIMRYVSHYYDLAPTAREQSGYSPMRWLDEFGVFSFVFEPSSAEHPPVEPADRDWFEEAGILICRGGTSPAGLPVGVALKGGHNGEHHNHNDVGSYVYCIGESMTLVDPGAEVYTRRTFSSKRYESKVLNSFGHPVPRIANTLQQTGRAAAAENVQLDLTDNADTLSMDFTSAYAVQSLQHLQRTFVFQRDTAQLSVTDTVKFASPQQFGTALITFAAWQKLDERRLRVGSGDGAVLITIDTGEIPVTIDAQVIDEDIRGGKQPTRIGIELAQPIAEATVRVTIQPWPGDQ